MTNKPGRPRIDDDERSVSVHTRIPTRDYDKMYAEAQRDRVSLSEWIRRRMRDREESKRSD